MTDILDQPYSSVPRDARITRAKRAAIAMRELGWHERNALIAAADNVTDGRSRFSLATERAALAWANRRLKPPEK